MPKDSQPDSKEQEAKKKRCCCGSKKEVDGKIDEDKIEEGPEFAVSGLSPEKKRCCKKKS